MKEFFARVVADSISPSGVRVTTLHLRYWRSIHAEFMTHRVFTRNARSSRAVPVVTLLAEKPYIPTFLQNQPGMVGGAELPPGLQAEARAIWLYMSECCKFGVEKLNALGAHKQHANRPLEWFGYIDVLVSSTDWSNFFALRDHGAAQPEIKYLANLIYDAMKASTPDKLKVGEWHLPYIDKFVENKGYASEKTTYWRNVDGVAEELSLETAIKVSAARCAGISYKPFDGNASLEAELKRYDSLVGNFPVHASPTEHQAYADELLWMCDDGEDEWEHPELHGNFYGWCQARKLIKGENIAEYGSLTR